MTDQPKIPSSYLPRVARDLDVGEKAYFQIQAMAVDPERRCWIDPFATPGAGLSFLQGEASVPLSDPYLSVERVAGGFKVDLSHIGARQFFVGAKPDLKFGESWIPVLEFTGAKQP